MIRSDTRQLPDGRVAHFADRRWGFVYVVAGAETIKIACDEWYALPYAVAQKAAGAR